MRTLLLKGLSDGPVLPVYGAQVILPALRQKMIVELLEGVHLGQRH